MDYAISVYDVPGIAFGSWGFNSRATINQGLFGGYGSPVMPFVRISNTNLKELFNSPKAKLPSRSWMTYEERGIRGTYQADKYPSPPRPAKEYDIVAGGSAGGGGYGDPIDRDPLLVMKDLEEGIISHRIARDIYQVAYNQETLLVDEEKTKALRKAEKENRIKRGMRYAVFERKWLKLRSDKEILQFYGDWPETKYKSFTYFGDWHK